MKGKKKAVVIAGICVVVLLAALAGLYTAVTWNTMPQEEKPEPSSELLGRVVQGALSGEEVEVTAEEANAYLAYLGENSHNELLQKLTLDIGEDGRLQIWLPVTVYGMDITAYCAVRPEFSKETIQLHIEETRAGLLPLPPSWMLESVEEKLPKGLELQGDTLIMDTPRFSLEEQGIDFSVGLEELKVENGKFTLRTDSVSDAIQDLLQLFLNGLLSSKSETVS